MTKKEICNQNSIGYYSGLNGLEIKDIRWEPEETVYSVSGAWNSRKACHRSKVYYRAGGSAYFIVNGYRIPLDECVRM